MPPHVCSKRRRVFKLEAPLPGRSAVDNRATASASGSPPSRDRTAFRSAEGDRRRRGGRLARELAGEQREEGKEWRSSPLFLPSLGTTCTQEPFDSSRWLAARRVALGRVRARRSHMYRNGNLGSVYSTFVVYLSQARVQALRWAVEVWADRTYVGLDVFGIWFLFSVFFFFFAKRERGCKNRVRREFFQFGDITGFSFRPFRLR